MTVRIVTDSSCDLPQDLIKKWGISVVPLYINLDHNSYLDGVELSRQEFYERLPVLKTPATTSVPGIGAFVKVYESLVSEDTSSILSIHVSSNLSNVVNVARLAAQAFNPVPIIVVDGGQLSLGTGVLVLEAAQAAARGCDASEITTIVKEKATRTYTFAVLDTLEYLRRSGRLSLLTSSLGSLLKIKPMLTMHAGEIGQDKVRTWKGAMDRLLEIAKTLGSLEQLALVHTHAIERVEELRGQISNIFPVEKIILIEEVAPVIGAHIGPGAVGFIGVTKGNS